jgi:hypothetical protein
MYKSGNAVIQVFSTFAPKIPYFRSVIAAYRRKSGFGNPLGGAGKRHNHGRCTEL